MKPLFSKSKKAFEKWLLIFIKKFIYFNSFIFFWQIGILKSKFACHIINNLEAK